mmetsp:Transcript_66183/g.137209  ORF Transcript_66183/g.137209 Transcript_66183/m.137209 type:complete len:93 (-) Transcript_66183:496-774(-)
MVLISHAAQWLTRLRVNSTSCQKGMVPKPLVRSRGASNLACASFPALSSGNRDLVHHDGLYGVVVASLHLGDSFNHIHARCNLTEDWVTRGA